MNFDVNKAIEILERTPFVLEAMLTDISDDWSRSNEGPTTWSPYDVIGHLIHGEKTDWIPRMELIFSDVPPKTFQPFDRFAQLTLSEGKSLRQLLEEFAFLRKENVRKLKAQNLTAADLNKTGIHPELGEVTLRQHLSTWVVHDLDHIAQVARVMAKQYGKEVGPWLEYLRILRS